MKEPRDEELKDKYWPHYQEDVLVDLLEDELDCEFKGDLELWLKRSRKDDSHAAREMAELNDLRITLKSGDNIAISESGAYYDALEARIMAGLDQALESGEIKDHGRVRNITGKVPDVLLPDAPRYADDFVGHRGRRSFRGIAMRTTPIFVSLGLLIVLSLLPGQGEDGSSLEAVTPTRLAASEVLSDTIVTLESDSDLSLDLVARENVNRMLASNFSTSKLRNMRKEF